MDSLQLAAQEILRANSNLDGENTFLYKVASLCVERGYRKNPEGLSGLALINIFSSGEKKQLSDTFRNNSSHAPQPASDPPPQVNPTSPNPAAKDTPAAAPASVPVPAASTLLKISLSFLLIFLSIMGSLIFASAVTPHDLLFGVIISGIILFMVLGLFTLVTLRIITPELFGSLMGDLKNLLPLIGGNKP